MSDLPPPRGLFVGLTTLDLIYHAERPPQPNEKVVADDMMFAAGGPATNAAIAFAALGGKATLLAVVGQHPLAEWIKADLAQYHVELIDLMPERVEPPTVSSIVVSGTRGDRAVISKNAQACQASEFDACDVLVAQHQVILMDGHQMLLSHSLAKHAEKLNIPRILDGGSWKQGTSDLIPHLSHIVLSANFMPPHCRNRPELLNWVQVKNNDALVAITQGEQPILWQRSEGLHEIPCTQISAVDTLGAGDFFHGAFAYYVLCNTIPDALMKAGQLATLSCQYPGTREWLMKI